MASAPNDRKMTLNGTRSKVPHVCPTNAHESHNFTPFRSTLARFPYNWGFSFPLRYNNELEIFEKIYNRQLKISNLHTVVVWEPLSGRWGQVWNLLAVICSRSRVLVWSIVNAKEKNPKRRFVTTIAKKVRRSVKIIGLSFAEWLEQKSLTKSLTKSQKSENIFFFKY